MDDNAHATRRPPSRILKVISPAGFERFFEELVDMGGVTQANPDQPMHLNERYGLGDAAGHGSRSARAVRGRVGKPQCGGWKP